MQIDKAPVTKTQKTLNTDMLVLAKLVQSHAVTTGILIKKKK